MNQSTIVEIGLVTSIVGFIGSVITLFAGLYSIFLLVVIFINAGFIGFWIGKIFEDKYKTSLRAYTKELMKRIEILESKEAEKKLQAKA